MSRGLTIAVVALAAILILVLAVVFVLVLRDVTSSDGVALAPTLAPTADVATVEPTELAPPVIEVPPTFTAVPSDTPGEPTITNTPGPTSTPQPSAVVPTNTPTSPPPTATSPPPPPAPPPTNPPPTNPPAPPPDDTRGLTATSFALQDRSSYTVNGRVWFEFNIVNTTGGEVPYRRLGVLPRKDGVDRYDWFQQSYGGPNAAMKPAGLSHEDNIKLPEAGSYTLRLAICFETWDACNSGGGSWATMSPEIPININ
jgi:hypothetical protein